MFTSIDAFAAAWERESESTRRMYDRLTPESLSTRVSAEGRSLGRLAWHVAVSLGEQGHRLGLPVEGPTEEGDVPDVERIRDTYGRASRSLVPALRAAWTDATLAEEFDMYGERWTGAFALMALLCHEIHHRGQMTVLMRQAGLAVPGAYGPAREEWAQYGMPAPV